jgi:hypothetical protein
MCDQLATLTDWRPWMTWILVESCARGGFFIEPGRVQGRVADLSESDRRDLALRIRTFRAVGHEAWCTTTDGTEQGPLVVRTERPDGSG